MRDKDRIIVTPAEFGTMGKQAIERLHDNRSRLMPILLPGLDHYFWPLEPGSLTVILAQTYNAKSWFINRWIQRMVWHLQHVGRDEVIVSVDTENSADYLAASAVARRAELDYSRIISSPGLDMTALFRAAADIAGRPIYTIATRLGEDEREVHLTNIKKGIEMLTTGQVDGTPRKIAAVCIDYLQDLPIDPQVKREEMDKQRRLQVSNDVDTCRRIAWKFDCPVILGVQAKQTPTPTEMYKCLGLPGSPYDGQETANIGQKPDRIISLSVAARNFGKGQVLNYHGQQFTVENGLLFVAPIKQRNFDNAGDVFAYKMSNDPDPMKALTNIWSEA